MIFLVVDLVVKRAASDYKGRLSGWGYIFP